MGHYRTPLNTIIEDTTKALAQKAKPKQAEKIRRQQQALDMVQPKPIPVRTYAQAVQGAALAGQTLARQAEANQAARQETITRNQALLNEGYRPANLYDLTIGSLKRGYNQSILGQEYFKASQGRSNQAAQYEAKLAGDPYKFVPTNTVGRAVSGASELLGQMGRQVSEPRTLGMAGAAAGTAMLAGQAGPQALVPEEILTVPGAAFLGFKAGSALSNMEIEAGFAYKEMLDNGINPDTAKNISLGVGLVNGTLEFMQLDDLAKAFKLLKNNDATKSVASRLAQELTRRGVAVGRETAQEVAQEASTLTGVNLANYLEGQDLYTKEAVASRLADTALQSALSFGVLQTPAGVRNTYHILKTPQVNRYTDDAAAAQTGQSQTAAQAQQAASVAAKRQAEILQEYEKVRTQQTDLAQALDAKQRAAQQDANIQPQRAATTQQPQPNVSPIAQALLASQQAQATQLNQTDRLHQAINQNRTQAQTQAQLPALWQAPIQSRINRQVENQIAAGHIDRRTEIEIKDKNVHAFQYDHPQIQPFYREQAQTLLNDLQNGVKGKRLYNRDGEGYLVNITGQKRFNSQPIEEMLDNGMRYEQIEKGLKRIIADNGQENMVTPKRIEKYLDKALSQGYRSMDGDIPINYEYLDAKSHIKGAAPNALYQDRETIDAVWQEAMANYQARQAQAQTQVPPQQTQAAAQNQASGQPLLGDSLQPPQATRFSEQQPQAQQIQQPQAEPMQQPQAQSQAQAEQQPQAEPMQQQQPQNEQQPPHVSHDNPITDADPATLNSQAVRFIARAAHKSGLNYRIVEGLDDHIAAYIEGETIVYNARTLDDTQAVQKATAHEIYHSLLNTTEHKKLMDMACQYFIDNYGSGRLTLEALIAAKQAEYAENGVTLDNHAALDEIGADFMEIALSDERTAQRILTEQPNLAKRILYYIQDKIRDYRTMRTLSEAQKRQYTMLRRAQTLYASGLKQAKKDRQANVQAETTRRHMFAEENSRTADFEALRRAKQMEREGADVEDILWETGWFKSKLTDGKWAYEISDKDVQLDPKDKPAQGRLSDYLDHPELYQAYPELADISLIIAREPGENYAGSYTHSNKELRLNYDVKDDFYDEQRNPIIYNTLTAIGVALHETQHAIQDIEGFPGGANLEYWDNLYKKENQRNQKMLDTYTEEYQTVTQRIEQAKERIGYNQYLSALNARIAQGEITTEQAQTLADEYLQTNAPKAYNDEKNYLPSLKERIDFYTHELKANNPRNLYQNTAGEIMARDTVARKKYDMEYRRAVEPEYGDDQTVYPDNRMRSYNMDNHANRRYSLNENASQNFARQIKRWAGGQMGQEEHFDLGDTPAILQNLGAKKLPIIMTQKVMSKINGVKHNIAWDELARLPAHLAQPLAILEGSKPDSFVVLTSLADKEGKNVIAAVHLNQKQKRLYVNRIASVYSKKNLQAYLRQNIAAGKLKYPDKEKTSAWFTNRGLQLPKLVQTNTDVDTIITDNAPLSNGLFDNLTPEQRQKLFRDENNTPNRRYRLQQTDQHKARQLAILQATNPMRDDYHTGIRSQSDILTFEEALNDELITTPDYTQQMAQHALQTGEITIYSSYPIQQGVFVTPSKMEAQNHAENGKVYTKRVKLEQVAWIDSLEGQYASVEDTRYSLGNQSRFEQLLDQYGAIEPGEAPHANRDARIPNQTNDFDRVRRFNRTAAEAQAVSDEVVEGIQDELSADIANGRLVYEPINNQDTLEQANAKLNTHGYEQAVGIFHAQFASGQRFTAADIALGERLIVEASNRGDVRTATELIADVAALGTEMGQAVQALRLLKRMTPEGRLMLLERTVGRINGKLTEEGKPTVSLNPQFREAMLEQDTVEGMDEVQTQALLDLADQMPATLADKINAWRYLAMLGNPRTHMRNIIGNAIFTPVRMLKDTLSLAAEQFLPTGAERTKALHIRPEYRKFAENDYEQARAIISTGGSKYDMFSQIERQKRIFQNPLLEKLRKWNENALEAEDMFFSKRAYVRALAGYLQANNLSPDYLQSTTRQSNADFQRAQNYAIKEAQKATFRDYSGLANALNQFERKNTATRIIGGAIMPFKKTPINILKRGVEYSPLGIAEGLTHGTYQLAKGKITPSEFIDKITAGLTGSGILALGYFLAAQGLLAADDDDTQKKAAYDRALGEQNYAIKLPNGASYTIDWMAPAVMPLMVGVELHHSLNTQYDEDVAPVGQILTQLTKVINPILETSMMQGVLDVMQSFQTGTGGQLTDIASSVAKSYGGQFIPTLAGQAARTLDDTRRSTYAPANSPITPTAERFLRQSAAKIPGLSKELEPQIDMWGREITQPGGNIGMRALNNFLNPGNYRPNTATTVDAKLNLLYDKTGKTKVLPATIGKSIDYDGKKYPLKASEYTRMQKQVGSRRYQDVQRLQQSTYIKQKELDDQAQANVIASLYEYRADQAKEDYLKKHGIAYENSAYYKIKQAESAGISPVDYLAVKQIFPGDYDQAKQKYDTCKQLNLDFETYKQITAHLTDLHADKNSAGKPIKDSRQKKVFQYLNNTKLTNQQKQYFMKQEYPSLYK